MRHRSVVVFSAHRDALAMVHSEIKFILNFMYFIGSLQVRQLIGSFGMNFQVFRRGHLQHYVSKFLRNQTKWYDTYGWVRIVHYLINL